MPEEQPKRGRDRPRKYEGKNDRQKAWKKKVKFEQSEARKAYKRKWARTNRLRKKSQKADPQDP